MVTMQNNLIHALSNQEVTLVELYRHTMFAVNLVLWNDDLARDPVIRAIDWVIHNANCSHNLSTYRYNSLLAIYL